MKYCSRCLYPANHPLHITFDEEGVCSGCRIHEEKDSLDWERRFERLLELVEPYRERSQYNYDCIIPVTGDGDSFFVLDVVKNRLGLRPLAVSYNTQYNTPIGIRNLARLRTVFDVDHMQKSVNPNILKRITRKTLHERGSMYWHCLAGWYTFPVQIAVQMRVPLIVWSVNGWSDQVGMYSHLHDVEMAEKSRREHGMMNLEANDLLTGEHAVRPDDIAAFRYPSDRELADLGVRGLYLDNFLRWDAKAQIEEMIEKYEYETAPQQRTFNTYETVGCWHAAGLHDYIKFLKWGFGKVTDHASREIRLKRLTREQGIDLVREYQWRKPKDLPMFLDWIELDEASLFANVDRFRDPSVWKFESGAWHLVDEIAKHKNQEGIEIARLDVRETCDYRVTPSLPEDDRDPAYVIIGRGWVDA